jgi:rfaE bifunctional protein nucleotidyltransferase chain/domain
MSAQQQSRGAGLLPGDNLATVLGRVRDWRTMGLSIVFTNGCFDLFHAGHVDLLEAAAALGDKLVVAVNSDTSVRAIKGNTRPIIGEYDRVRVVAAIGCVDSVVLMGDTTPERLVTHIKPDVHVKGGDWQADELPEAAIVQAYGGKVVIIPQGRGISATSIIESIRTLT